MIIPGLDAVAVERCALWHTYSPKKLSRLFSADEIAYCMCVPAKSAERFAVRLAAKEALYKALSGLYGKKMPPFLTLARHACIVRESGAPSFFIDWQALWLTQVPVLVTLTHTREIAIAQVLLCASSDPASGRQ